MMSSSTLTEQESLLLASLQKACKGWKSFDWSGKVSQWEATTTQNREARDSSQAARKQLSENTKSFKKSVKIVETAGISLGSNPSEENIVAAVKAIESVAKLAKVTVKSYQGLYELSCVIMHLFFSTLIFTICAIVIDLYINLQRKLIT
jgi:hypothetical protein